MIISVKLLIMSRNGKKENKKEKNNDDDTDSPQKYLKEETLRAIIAVLFFVLGVFFVLSAFSNGGKVGEISFKILHDNLFGVGYYLLPIIFFILCVSFFRTLHKRLALTHSIGGLLFFLSALSLINITRPPEGGLVGNFISKPLLQLFDTPVSIITLIEFIVISFLIMIDVPFRFTFLSSLF
jgi:hypothetical protein